MDFTALSGMPPFMQRGSSQSVALNRLRGIAGDAKGVDKVNLRLDAVSKLEDSTGVVGHHAMTERSEGPRNDDG